MELVQASEILYGVGARAGLTRAEIAGDLFKDLRGFVSKRLDQGRRYAKWPELIVMEERWFRNLWSVLTGYVADQDTVYYSTTGKYYDCILSNTGQAPTNATYWREVTALDSYVPYEQLFFDHAIGTVFGVWERNPKTQPGGPRLAGKVDYWRSENGVQAPKGVGGTLATVWIEFRKRSPKLFGDVWSATATYGANVGQVYFAATTGGPGDFYDCIVNTSAGQSPASVASSWRLVEIPRFLEEWLVGSVYADYLEGDGQTDKSMAELGEAMVKLEEQRILLEAQEGQQERTECVTR